MAITLGQMPNYSPISRFLLLFYLYYTTFLSKTQLLSQMNQPIDSKIGKNTNTLFFLHGNSSSAAVFDHFFEHHTNFSLQRINLPGHNGHKSHDPENDYSFDGLKSFIGIAFPKNFPFIIIGNSLGGHLAIEVAGDFPNCKGLVIFGTPPLKKPLNPHEAFLSSEALSSFLKADYTDEELEKTFAAVSQFEALRPLLMRDFVNTDPLFRHHFAHSGLQLGQLGDEAKIVEELGIPVHVIHGLQDPSANLAYIKTLPGITKIYEIDKCGHYPSVEQPVEFKRLVESIAGSCF